MAWMKIDVTVPRQVKFMKAGPVASWLWLAGVAHCRESNTDGHISTLILPVLVPGLRHASKHASKLVEVGLWRSTDTGYEVNDYLEWNPSKAEVEELRRLDTDRKKQKRGIPASVRTDSNRTPNAHARASAISTLSTLSGSGSDLGKEESVDWRADLRDVQADVEPVSLTPPVWSASRPSRESALGASEHRSCDPATLMACRRGFCVPVFYPRRWRQQIDPERRDQVTTDQFMRDFVARWLAKLPDSGPVGGTTPEKFWGEAWEAEHSTNAPQGIGRSADRASRTLAAGKTLIQQQLAKQGKVS